MPMILKASLWALAILTVGMLGALGVIPKAYASHLSVLLPGLAVAVLILPACASSKRAGSQEL